MVTVSNDSGDVTGAGSWVAVIRDPGQSTFESAGEGATVITVPGAQLTALRNAIESERFFKLHDDYGVLAADRPEMQITVDLADKVHQVVLHPIEGAMSRRESGEVDRAMRVWSAALDCLPQDARPGTATRQIATEGRRTGGF
jgi:hypothetical protein